MLVVAQSMTAFFLFVVAPILTAEPDQKHIKSSWSKFPREFVEMYKVMLDIN
jgi:hypothetical protein